jgi:hypothetical protein
MATSKHTDEVPTGSVISVGSVIQALHCLTVFYKYASQFRLWKSGKPVWRRRATTLPIFGRLEN